MKNLKENKYTAMSVRLNVKPILAAANGSRQFTICVRTTTKKRVLELLVNSGNRNTSLFMLNSFNGLIKNNNYWFNPPLPETIYFLNNHVGTPHCFEWLNLNEWLNNL